MQELCLAGMPYGLPAGEKGRPCYPHGRMKCRYISQTPRRRTKCESKEGNMVEWQSANTCVSQQGPTEAHSTGLSLHIGEEAWPVIA